MPTEEELEERLYDFIHDQQEDIKKALQLINRSTQRKEINERDEKHENREPTVD